MQYFSIAPEILQPARNRDFPLSPNPNFFYTNANDAVFFQANKQNVPYLQPFYPATLPVPFTIPVVSINHYPLNQSVVSNNAIPVPSQSPGPSIITCHLCGRTYTLRKSYVAHLRRHRQKFFCSVCPKVFPAKHDLRRHLLCVHGIKTDKTTDLSSSSLSVEKDNEKLTVPHFVCDKCGRNFNQKANLRRHQVQNCNSR